ncbi:methyltransferase domain-containing protein [Aquimarina rhabdastrellae]
MDKDYWNYRYVNHQTKWDIGHVSPPIAAYIDQLPHQELRILIPGSGNSYEAEYLLKNGFQHVDVLDFVPEALHTLKSRVPLYPDKHLLCKDFFSHTGAYDLIFEQTFFCALAPHRREDYVLKIKSLLKPNGKLVGLLFNKVFEQTGPPFGGTKEEYLSLFAPFFKIKTLALCYNSISPRHHNELFFIFENLK